jgi:hypothetical protein
MKKFIDDIRLYGVLTYSRHSPVDKFQAQEASSPAHTGYFNLCSLHKQRRARGSVLGYGSVTSWKVAGSSPDEVDFSIYLVLPAVLWPWGRLSL